MRFLFALLACLPLAALAGDFGTIPIEKGYRGPVVVEVVWASDGTPRDITGSIGTFTVYKLAPRAGVGGTILFQHPMEALGTPTNYFIVSIQPEDVAVPGSYYTEITISEVGTTDPIHGTIVVTGR